MASSTQLSPVRGRRGSLESTASRRLPNSETLASTLDHIHSNASTANCLTTFSEYAPPPRSANSQHSKTLAEGLVYGGFTGLYSRLKASVGTGRDAEGSPPASSASHQEKPHGVVAALPLSRSGASHLSAEANYELGEDENYTPSNERASLNPNRPTPPIIMTSHLDRNLAATVPRQDKALESRSTVDDRQGLVHSKDPLNDSTGPSLPVHSLQRPYHTDVKDSDTLKATAMGFESAYTKGEDVPNHSQRPPLQHISQSHLPGYHPSRTTSSDGDLNSESLKDSNSRAESFIVTRGENLQSGSSDYIDHHTTRMASRLLAKEFWMKDENARDCFYCGDTFSTFRRKHHCRTCGQIFDAKCTAIVPGKMFGSGTSIRICRPCEKMIAGNNDDSSSYSEASGEEEGRHDHRLVDSEGDVGGDVQTPSIGVPVSRKAVKRNHHKSAVLEFGPPHALARPSSSRSLRSIGGHHRIGHTHAHAKSGMTRGQKPFDRDRAPFQEHVHDHERDKQLSVFHHENIIDPELAPFLSDDGSSDDDAVSLFATIEGDVASSPARTGANGPGFNALFSSTRRSKLKGERLMKDADPTSFPDRHLSRHSRRRNVSLSSASQVRDTPLRTKSSSLLKSIPYFSASPLQHQSDPDSVSRAMSSHVSVQRSSSMRGDCAPPVELNLASLQHVQRMLRQLLQDAKIPSQRAWQRALLPILLRCTNDVSPDIRRHDFIDIRHYIKIKRVPGARPGDTSYISGVIFSKNVALKSMSRSLSQPRIIIVRFAIEYARQNQHFMSLEPVIAQEKEYLRNLVRRIVAFDPQVLLVQKNVSGLALELLADFGITVVCNVKASVLNAVARCTQAKQISSVDKLVFDPALVGHAGSFDVKTFMHNNAKKTFVWVSGCRPDLGCTIVLRGAKPETLRRLKRITEFMCYVVYNLRLETNLMRDEYAFIPSERTETTVASALKGDASTAHVNAPTESLIPDAAVDTSGESHEMFGHDGSIHAEGRMQTQSTTSEANTTNEHESTSLPPPKQTSKVPSFYDDVLEKHKTKVLSTSPFVQFMPPYLLTQVREQESRLARLKETRDRYEPDETSRDATNSKFQLVQPEMVRESSQKLSKQVKDFLYAVHDAEYDKAMFGYMTQKRQWESYLSETINLFDPFSHQRIAFLYSMVNSQSTTPCIGPEVVALEFYNEQEVEGGYATDITLGQYVVDLVHGANSICGINGCEKTLFHHHRQYVHGSGQMSVYIQKHAPKLPGLQGTILMWSQCRICKAETPPIPMSDSTWRYSFGKYLELTFWSSELHPRAKVCPHDIHRDHLRYFGLHNAAVRVQFDPIELHEVVTPRSIITWKVESDLRLKNEQFQKLKDKLDRFMYSVKARIKSIHIEAVLPEKVDSCTAELKRLTQAAEEDCLVLTKKLQDKYMRSRYYEIIPFNRALRSMHERAIWWDDAFADFERNFFPSEKDIRRLAQQQLRKLFIEKDPSTQSLEESNEDHDLQTNEKVSGLKPEAVQLNPSPSDLSKEAAQDLLKSGLEKVTTEEKEIGALCLGTAETNSGPIVNLTESTAMSEVLKSQDVKHLDLAVSDTSVALASAKDLHEAHSAKVDNIANVGAQVDHLQQGSPSEHGAPEVPREVAPESRIPRPIEHARPENSLYIAPPLSRAYSQPAESMRSQQSKMSNTEHLAAKPEMQKTNLREVARGLEKRLAERIGGTLRVGRNVSQSLIPRSVGSGNRDLSRVSTLAKHFELLTRELERERLQERRMRTAKIKQAREYPLASSRPTMEIFSDAHQAARERTSPEESRCHSPDMTTDTLSARNQIPVGAQVDVLESRTSSGSPVLENIDVQQVVQSHIDADSDNVTLGKDSEESDMDSPIESNETSLAESQLDLNLEIPKSDKVSLMKMLRSFWSERSASGWAPLEYPLLPTEHIWDNSDVIVREDEPSSIIALALSDKDYLTKLRSFRESPQAPESASNETQRTKKGATENLSAEAEDSVEKNMLREERTHISYAFIHRGVRARCKIFYAESFDAIRRKCGIADRFVESMSRCLKWDSRGGKTRSLFLKTMDDRFVLKSLSQPEVTAFFKFAPNYFSFMHQILFKSLPSVIAKMFGLFQITVKNPATGVEFDWFMLVMENLFYHREPDRRFDLKGSMRNRKIQITGERDEVLQDENLVDIIFEKPLFVREHTMTLLQACVWNDTLFLSQQNVMDYSLMAGFVDARYEIIVGIIDCIRTYTWDKKLETWIKDRGKNKPTITSPKDYKNRFRMAMSKYILLAPNCWHHFQSQIQKRPLQLNGRHDTHEEVEGAIVSGTLASTTV